MIARQHKGTLLWPLIALAVILLGARSLPDDQVLTYAAVEAVQIILIMQTDIRKNLLNIQVIVRHMTLKNGSTTPTRDAFITGLNGGILSFRTVTNKTYCGTSALTQR